MALQYGLPEAARSAVRQQQQALSIKAGLLETVVIHNLLHLLQFSEMVTAANRSQGAAPGMGQQIFRQMLVQPACLRNVLHSGQFLLKLIRIVFSREDIRLPQRHAAADIVTHQCRVEMAQREEGCADGIATPGM